MIERLNRLGLCQQEQETLIWKASRFQDLKCHFYALSLSLYLVYVWTDYKSCFKETTDNRRKNQPLAIS